MPHRTAAMSADADPPARPGVGEALRFWLLLGCISFGGPAGQVAIMHAELVDKRRWVGEADFLRALNFCMLLPGPEAMQLATWLGWRLHGVRGGVAAGALFVLPAAVLLGFLSWLYLRVGHVPAVSGALFALQAAVLGIIVHALQRIAARVIKGVFAMALALAALLVLALTQTPFPLLLAGAALAGLWAGRFRPTWLPMPAEAADAVDASGNGRPMPRSTSPRLSSLRVAASCLVLWWLPLLAVRVWLGPDSTAHAMGLFFSKAALLTVGGAYAVLPYVAEQAVETHGWLEPAQMMAGLGLAETTPGPLILVLEFVGFVGGWQHPDLATPLASALLGASVTLWATFLPSFLFVLTAAPWIDRIGRWRPAHAMLSGVTAAVVGVIANLALWFGARLLSPLPWPALVFALAIASLTWLGLARWRWPVYLVVPAAALTGAFLQRWLPFSA
ncbi:chromate efflux transporter [Montanilutibacter psychrotolerans]|nr:chromate efflux transporter [Lysobacter psychrotolerans]